MHHPRVRVKIDGTLLSVSAAARRIGISPMGLWDRLRRGVPRSELLKPGYGPRMVAGDTPFRAAINGEISAEEYLQREEAEVKGR